MRLLIGTFGTRGDVQPMVALGQELQHRGHSVTLVVPPNSVEWTITHGLSAIAAGVDYQQMTQKVADGKLRPALLQNVKAEVEAQREVMEPLARQSDLVLGSGIFTVGSFLADLCGIPYAYAVLCPQLFPSNEHPMLGLRWHGLPKVLNRWSWRFQHHVWNFLLKETINNMRRRYRLKPVDEVLSSLFGKNVLVACDERLGPLPQDVPYSPRAMGAWFAKTDETLSAETEAFLQAGSPPVYIGFGSMNDPHPQRTTDRLLHSVKIAQVRAIVSRGWAGLDAKNCPENVLLVGPEPHTLLFPRCAAIIHHGGAGTTHAAARAGVPQVVMPQLLDQFYWARRVEALGLGVQIERFFNNPETLAQAMFRVLSEHTYVSQARCFAAGMRLDGVSRGATVLEEYSKH